MVKMSSSNAGGASLIHVWGTEIPQSVAKIYNKITCAGTSLVVQCLRLHAHIAGGRGSIPGQGGSHMLQGMDKIMIVVGQEAKIGTILSKSGHISS